MCVDIFLLEPKPHRLWGMKQRSLRFPGRVQPGRCRMAPSSTSGEAGQWVVSVFREACAVCRPLHVTQPYMGGAEHSPSFMLRFGCINPPSPVQWAQISSHHKVRVLAVGWLTLSRGSK